MVALRKIDDVEKKIFLTAEQSFLKLAQYWLKFSRTKACERMALPEDALTLSQLSQGATIPGAATPPTTPGL